LDKLHEEIKEDESSLNHLRNDRVPPLRTHKSEGELAIDALERISGGKSSTIMNIFRGQFRSSMECTNPICGFANLTFDPYLTVSLSIPLPKRFVPLLKNHNQIFLILGPEKSQFCSSHSSAPAK
jgi:ubiquitin C-terminal hydrolase